MVETKQASWLSELTAETQTSDFGLEITNGIEYSGIIDLTEKPEKITETFEGNETVKWVFNFKLTQWDIVEKLDLELLKRDNLKKYERIQKIQTGMHKLKLSKSQTNQFSKFLSEAYRDSLIADEANTAIVIRRTGQSFKTKYNFELV